MISFTLSFPYTHACTLIRIWKNICPFNWKQMSGYCWHLLVVRWRKKENCNSSFLVSLNWDRVDCTYVQLLACWSGCKIGGKNVSSFILNVRRQASHIYKGEEHGWQFASGPTYLNWVRFLEPDRQHLYNYLTKLSQTHSIISVSYTHLTLPTTPYV